MNLGTTTLTPEFEEFLNKLAASPGTVYGTCETPAGTAAKVISLVDADAYELKVGSTMVVKFSETNTAESPTFNVNNQGAKKVWYNAALITTSSLEMAGTANVPMMYVYDGTNWVFISWSFAEYAYITQEEYDELDALLDSIH